MTQKHQHRISDFPNSHSSEGKRDPGCDAALDINSNPPDPALSDDTGESTDDRHTPTVPVTQQAIWVSMRVSQDFDITNPSMSTEILALKERHVAKLSNKKKMSIGVLVMILMTSLVGFFIWQVRVKKPLRPRAPAVEKVITSAKQAAAKAPVNAIEAASGENDIINIRFSDLPEGATILFDQQPVVAPIRTIKSKTPHFLEITNGQGRLFASTIVPDRDRFIAVPNRAEYKKKKKESPKMRPIEPVRKTPKESGQGDLSSNPFPLKKNPFAVGE